MQKIQLESGYYKKGYCDGHEREDVIEARNKYISTWKSLEERMHLWFRDQYTNEWRHVDEFKLKGDGSLNRDSLGPFGGDCKVGIEWAENPDDRPLLTLRTTRALLNPKRRTLDGGSLPSRTD